MKEYVIETQDLTKRYGKVEAVRSMNLAIAEGQITGFLGRNGAGKSTTIKMLLGMTRPTHGNGKVLGRLITNSKANCEMRRDVAFVGEDKQLYAYMTVAQMIRFTKSFYQDWRPEVEQRLLGQYQLPLDRRVKALSKGMRTKLALLMALARRPKLLILDEPSEGLDPVAIEELLQSLVAAAGDGSSVFFSSHQIAEVERIADRICIIDHGNLKMDFSLEQLRQHYRRITIGFAYNPPPLESPAFKIDGVEHVRTNGRQVVLLTGRNVDMVVAQANRMDAVSVDVEPVSLREVFLETVREVAK